MAATAVCAERRAEDASAARMNMRLDMSLIVLCCAVIAVYEVPSELFLALIERLQAFPDHYDNQFDFVAEPVNGSLAIGLFFLYCYSWGIMHIAERGAIARAQRKRLAPTWAATQPYTHSPIVVALHGLGSFVEMALGVCAILWRDDATWAHSAAILALAVNIPTGLLLTPRVGIKHLIVPVFWLWSVCRALEAVRVLYLNDKLLPNLWILLQVGTAVRLVGYYLTPYSSKDGGRGDLFTEPLCYSFTILISGTTVRAPSLARRRLMRARRGGVGVVGGRLRLPASLYPLLLRRLRHRQAGVASAAPHPHP